MYLQVACLGEGGGEGEDGDDVPGFVPACRERDFAFLFGFDESPLCQAFFEANGEEAFG